MSYMAFLKLKANEVSAVAEVVNAGASPLLFFDIPKPLVENEVNILDRLRIGEKSLLQNIPNVDYFLDNFDLDDSIALAGCEQYAEILRYFSDTKIHPVIGLHRGKVRNVSAINFAKNENRRLALRLTEADIESFSLTESAIDELFVLLNGFVISDLVLVFDLRVIVGNPSSIASQIADFAAKFSDKYKCGKYVVSGSSIPASIRDLLKTSSSIEISRRELDVWRELKKLGMKLEEHWVLGDYGVVSPDYTDTELDFGIVVKTAAPKAIYAFKSNHLIVRGGAFQSHKDGYQQYYAIADSLVNKPFFRKSASSGDKYIYVRSYASKPRAVKAGSPGSWLKATLVSHITYMLNFFS